MGEEWETSEGGFLRLKMLFISGAILKHWYSRGEHFPVLERLSLHFCLFLEEIPTGFTDVLTLQFIELNKCHSSLVESARKIQVEQADMYGRDDLLILDYNTWQQ
ncbi:putative late blight resistance protein homolog R1A-3 [Ipomoea triloba]|uniref:putative late blight resistance protein homolog R1A-3 n=1 Tax=Ipomoea triloba TaxID=35885 RepID=UPI00125E15A8|nr:putative late blight resistance protein homolog R1A-3 [Ipomoea triloba]